MTSRTMMLNRIQEYCHLKCPHRETCAERDNCPIYPFKDGKVPQAFKKTMTQSQLRNLSKSPRNGKALKAKQLEEPQEPVWTETQTGKSLTNCSDFGESLNR